MPRILFAHSTKSSSVSFGLWAFARGAAIILGGLLVWLLFHITPLQAPYEPAIIKGEWAIEIAPIENPTIVTPNLPAVGRPAPAPKSAPPVQPIATPVPTKIRTPGVSLPQVAGVSGLASKPAPRLESVGPARIASAAPASAPSPKGQGANESGNRDGATAPALPARSKAILRARECLRLGERDRPADCPPNAELGYLAKSGPQYRPENADAFSRNEQVWRGIPPPCLDNGEGAQYKNGKLCVRMGATPSRVRSPQEICEARGLGGCAPVPNQAAINAAIAQSRAQEPANQACAMTKAICNKSEL
ncbi:MAG: hypothetical protein HC777_00340 [Hyphomonadaceae bacterium]|nr:hypothetical protein [Hyphomonadaceae bacterium]